MLQHEDSVQHRQRAQLNQQWHVGTACYVNEFQVL